MKNRVLNMGTGLAMSILVGLAAIWTLDAFQLKYLAAILISLTVFFLIGLYTPYRRSFSFSLNQPAFGTMMFFLGWVFAVLLILVVNPLETYSQFVWWSDIPALIWLRLIAAFLLTTIYPGYALTLVAFRKSNLRFLETVIFSLLSSIFISSSIAFAGMLIENSIGATTLLFLLSINIFLLTLSAYLKRTELFSLARTSRTIVIKSRSLMGAFLLLSLIAFVLLAVYSVNFPDKFVPTIDEWYHYGNTLRALNGTLFTLTPYYYWLYMYEGILVFASGFPPINAFMTTFVLALLPVLSFYLLSSAFWDKSKALVATTVYTLFSGLGGIYADYLRLSDGPYTISTVAIAGDRTYDIWVGAVSFSFYLFPKIVGLSVLFALFYLTYDRRLPQPGKNIIVSILFALGYLSHVAEVLIFLAVAVVLIFISREAVRGLKSLSSGLVLGMIVTVAVDILAPQKKYGFYNLLTGNFTAQAFLPIGLVGLLFLLSRVQLGQTSVQRLIGEVGKRLSPYLLTVLIYVLALGVLIWIFLLPGFSSDSLGDIFAWYLYPVRMGIVLFMAVIGGYMLFRRREFKVLKLSLAIVIASVAVERVLTYLASRNVGQFLFFPPSRMVEFTWIGVAILATPVLIAQLEHITRTRRKEHKLRGISRKYSAAALLLIVFVVASSSTLYNVQFRSTPFYTLSDSELEAMDYLRNETPSNVTVLALGVSANRINDFAGRYPVLYYSEAIFGATTAEGFLDVMRRNTYELRGNSPIRYLWLGDYDTTKLREYRNSYLVGHLLEYLPIAYRNSRITIFEIPLLSPPVHKGNLTVIKSPLDASDSEILLSHEAIALSELSYSVKPDLEPCPNSTQVLLRDVNTQQTSFTHRPPQTIIPQGTTIVLNSLEYGNQSIFSRFLALGMQPTMHTVDGISGPNGNITFPSLDVPLFYSNDSEVTPVAFYIDRGVPVSPYAFSKKSDQGDVVYVQIYPYLDALQQKNGTDEGRSMFRRLGNLIAVLGLPVQKYQQPLESNECAIMYGQITLTGDMTVLGSSFYVPALETQSFQTIGWKKDTFESGWFLYTDQVEHGYMDASPGDILNVSFYIDAWGIRQELSLFVPSINSSRYHYLIMREKIDTVSYGTGYLGCVIGGYTYTVRSWTSGTDLFDHTWRIHVFDLNRIEPAGGSAPTPPEGMITRIFWARYSDRANGGTATLSLDYVMLASSPFAPAGEVATSLDLERAISVFIDNVTSTQKTISNLKTLSLEITGALSFSFASTMASVVPLGSYPYSAIAFGTGCKLIMRLTEDSRVILTGSLEGKQTNITIVGGMIGVDLIPLNQGLVAYISEAEISSSGNTTFGRAFISWPYNAYDLGSPMVAQGMMKLRIDVMDQDFSLASNIAFEGERTVSPQQRVSWNEWNIPWIAVLVSPLHVLLVAAFAATLIVYRVDGKRHQLVIKAKRLLRDRRL